MAFIYANRSITYLECKKYEECIQNIRWAKENGYSKDKQAKLEEREKKCNKLMQAKHEADDEDPDEDPKNFFKLSHPANQKIPFLADCLIMKTTKQFGRGIYTTIDLNAGDIIAVERSVMTSLSTGGQYIRCCHCLQISMMNLIPCLKSASLMFCSLDCRDRTYKKVGENLDWMISNDAEFKIEKLVCDVEEAFGGRDKLVKFLKENDIRSMKNTFFDFDLSDPSDPNYKQNSIKCILSLNHKPLLSVLPTPQNVTTKARTIAKGNQLIEKFVNHLIGVFHRNASPRAYVKRGDGLSERNIEGRTVFVFKQLLNHSCMPNIDKIGGGIDWYYYATMPIKAGEQLFLDYL